MAIFLGKLVVLIFPLLTVLVALAVMPLCSHGLPDQPLRELNYKPTALVTSPTTQLQYHKGPLLTAPINVYLIWYGSFSPALKATVSDFFASFTAAAGRAPTVSTWWRTAQGYKDAAGKPVSSTVRLSGQISDAACSIGKNLRRADVSTLVRNSILRRAFPLDSTGGVYLVLTAADVAVERFCMGSCGFHVGTAAATAAARVLVAHVGDPSARCPGLCAWPFAKPAYGPPGPPLVAPNGIGADGVVMNVAAVLAGAATNPRGDGYYQGNRLAPLEAATACAGVFGRGAYPGYPGELKVDPRTKASFNVYGVNGRVYLLPAIGTPGATPARLPCELDY